MKKSAVILLLLLVFFALAATDAAEAAGKWFNRNARTGGAADALDAIDGNSTGMDSTLSRALVIESGMVYFYDLELTGAPATESDPYIILPDTNPGTKYWSLIQAFAEIISSDTTYYVNATTGSDTTGNGSASTPWETLSHALDYVGNYWWNPQDVTVTIELSSETHTATADIVANHPCGAGLVIKHTASATSFYSITGVGNDGTYDYITVATDVTAKFPASSTVRIVSDTSGDNNGAYTVNSATHAGGTTTIDLNEDLVDNSACNGTAYDVPESHECILSMGGYSFVVSYGSTLKSMYGFKLLGADDPGVADKGLYIHHGGSITSTSTLVIESFNENIYLFKGGSYILDGSNTASLVSLDPSNTHIMAYINCYAYVDYANLCHNGSYGIRSYIGSKIYAGSAKIIGPDRGMYAADNSYIDASSSEVKDCSVNGYEADDLSRIDAAGATTTGNTTDYVFTDGSIILSDNGAYIDDDPKAVTITAAGPSTVDVSGGVDLVIMDCASAAVVIEGFSGGSANQIIDVVKRSSSNTGTLEHNEGAGGQDIYLSGNADETITYIGGWRLHCNGSNWAEVGN